MKTMCRLHNLRELTQVWAFGEDFAEPVHQAINELEMIPCRLPPRELLTRRIRQFRQTGPEAVPMPAAMPVPAGESREQVFALEPEEKAENNSLFEYNRLLDAHSGKEKKAKDRDTDFLRSQLILRERFLP